MAWRQPLKRLHLTFQIPHGQLFLLCCKERWKIMTNTKLHTVPLNNITIKNKAPLPLIADLLNKLHSAWHFTKLDIQWGYNNVHIKEGDEWKAAFKTKFGLYKPLVMMFGLYNTPATFQTIMQEIFSNLINDGYIIVYLNNIFIFHESLPALTSITHEVL